MSEPLFPEDGALRASEARFRSLFDRAPIGLAQVDLQGRILSANTAVQEILGYDEHELCLMTFVEITHPEDRLADLALFEEVLAGTRDSYSMDKRYIRKDGRVVWGHLVVSVTRDQRGAPQSIIGMLLDVTDHQEAEERLRQSEAQYRRIVEAAQEGIWQVDAENRITFVNQKMAEMLGYSAQEMMGASVFSFYPEQDWPRAISTLERRRQGILDQYDVRYRRKDGADTWARLSASPLFDEAGQYAGALALVADISERRESDEARARLAAIVASSDDAITGTTLDGIITSWNDGASRLYGYSAEEALGRPISFVMPPDQPDQLPRLLDRLQRGERIRQDETMRVCKDGTHVQVSASIFPIIDANGTIVGAGSISRDITERKQAAHALEQAKAAAEELARLGQEQAEEAVAMAAVSAALSSTLELSALYQLILEQATKVLPCDHAGVCLYANGMSTYIASWGEPRITPGWTYPLTDLWLPEADSPVSYVPDTLLEPSWLSVPPLVGAYRERSIIGAPLRLDNTLVGSFEVSSRTPHLYSERHRRLAAVFADRAAQALRNARLYEVEQGRRRAAEDLALLRNDFVAAVSHELRTPLTAIVGFGELLQARWHQLSDAHRLQRIAHIVAAANRQKRLVEDLLLLSRLEVDRLVVACETVLLIPLIHRAVAEVQGSYRAQRIILAGPADVHVHADAARVAQVLMNLLDNGAKYSPEGSPVTLSWSVEGALVIVRTIDQGSGVPTQGREHLFTRFGRVPGSKMRSGRVGTGLGLYLSRRLAEAMGGEIDLEATGPAGSTFRLQLPLALDQSPPSEARTP